MMSIIDLSFVTKAQENLRDLALVVGHASSLVNRFEFAMRELRKEDPTVSQPERQQAEELSITLLVLASRLTRSVAPVREAAE